MITYSKLIREDSKDLVRLLKQLTEKEFRFDIDELLGNRNFFTVVAEDNGRLIGYGSISFYRAVVKGLTGVIEDIVVDRGYRGKGIGTEIVVRLVAEAKRRGARMIVLTSNPKNANRLNAIKIYKALGFEPRDTIFFQMKL